MPETETVQEGQETAEAKSFSQEDVDRIVRDRVARVKREAPADYEELKEKAAKFDEAQEAAKADLEKALERAAKAEEALAAMVEADKRRAEISKAAKEYGVDPDILSRMEGDIAENAAILQSKAPKSYPTIRDDGETSQVSKSKAQIFGEAISNALN